MSKWQNAAELFVWQGAKAEDCCMNCLECEHSWEWSIWYEEERKKLIDALYDMIVKLKEEGVI